MNKDPLSILRKILASKDKNFTLLADDFVPVKFVSISKIRDFQGEKHWKGEDRFGNVILMCIRDTYLFLGIGENELSALIDARKIAYFNFDDVQIDDINKYLKIEFPPLYSDN